MNILFVAHEKALNGASLSLIGIIDELMKENKIYVLTNHKEGKFLEELRKRNINIIYSKYRWWMITKDESGFKWLKEKLFNLIRCQLNYYRAFKIKEKIKDEKIDIIHSNTMVLNIGAILSKMCNIPHVWHIREFGKEDQNLEFLYPKKYAFRYINKHSDYLIAVSKAIYNKYQKELNSNKFKVIYNGVNEKNVYQKEFYPNRENINIIICGSITKGKRQSDAILAIDELVKRGYKNINLKIAGSGLQNQVEKLKKLITDLNLNEEIELLGQVDNLIDVRKNSDIELVCSKCEAFGRVTIEAMMGMIPVIGANTGGTTELIKDGYNGFLFKQADYVDLADKIEIFLKDRNKIEIMGRNAYEFSKVFTSKLNANEIYDVYKKIICN